MEELFANQEQFLINLSLKERYLLSEIDWSNRLIGIKGARGSGKTTLILQYIKTRLPKGAEPLYVSLDNLFFLENTMVSLAKELMLKGGTHLILDEVHKYPNWSRELKLIYDQFPKLKIVFTSSSMLEIYKGESDLSRRSVTYHLKELSFREYILFETGHNISKVSLEELVKNHKTIAQEIKKQVPSPIMHFQNYLKMGAYPYYLENKISYIQKLKQTINVILENDLIAIENMSYQDSRKIKKLLVAIAESVPFVPNITKLSERLGMSRVFLLNAIKILNRADMIMELFKSTKGIGALTKPEKLYLNNANLLYVLGKGNVEIGTVRETFFANQMEHIYQIHLAERGDFLVEGSYTFEIGGKGKNSKQISGLKDSYVVRDDMEVGSSNVIPLYLFGFLY